MRLIGMLSVALLATALSLSCSSSSNPSSKEQIAAADAKTAAAKAKHDERMRASQKTLDDLDEEYKALERRAAETKGDAKKELDQKVKAAKDKRDAAAKKVNALRNAGHDQWEKEVFEDVRKDLD